MKKAKITKKQLKNRLKKGGIIIYYFIYLFYTINLLKNGYFTTTDYIYFFINIFFNSMIYINTVDD